MVTVKSTKQLSLTSTLFSTLSPLTSSWTFCLRVSFTLRPTASRTLSTNTQKITTIDTRTAGGITGYTTIGGWEIWWPADAFKSD